MAGQPRKRAMIAELERRAAAFDDATVLEYAVDWIGSGKSITELADDISDTLGHGDEYVTRHMLSKYLNALPGGAQALAEARGEGAHGLAESGIKMVDEAADSGSKEQIAGAKSAADFRLRMAGHWNRADYAPQQNGQVNVQVNFGQQHLDALRRRSVQGRVEAPAALPAGPDVEVVSDA
jgi:hypothetical protein